MKQHFDIHLQAPGARATPLHVAVGNKDLATIQRLIKEGADPDAQASSIRVTPLHIAVIPEVAEPEIIACLLDAKADPDIKDNSDCTPLFYAIGLGGLSAIRLLLKAGANPNAQDIKGRTALHYELKEEHIDLEIVKVLLDNGADPDIREKNGLSSLHYAAASKQAKPEVVQLLLDRGANSSLVSKAGSYAADLVRNQALQNDPVLERLRAGGHH